MPGVNIVAHNLQGMFTNRQLGITNNNRAKSSEKLSSGYKINRAADDAAGLSISEKMRRQIRGLTQGTENAQDGVSLCQIADGALAEVGDMLHRITELSVKSANGTNSPSDRQDIQAEINEILQEIDRVSNTTKFNEEYLFGKPGYNKNFFMTREEAMQELSSGAFDTVSKDIIGLDGKLLLSKDSANAVFATMSCYYAFEDINDDYKNGLNAYDGCRGAQTYKTSQLLKMEADAVVLDAKTYQGYRLPEEEEFRYNEAIEIANNIRNSADLYYSLPKAYEVPTPNDTSAYGVMSFYGGSNGRLHDITANTVTIAQHSAGVYAGYGHDLDLFYSRTDKKFIDVMKMQTADQHYYDNGNGDYDYAPSYDFGNIDYYTTKYNLDKELLSLVVNISNKETVADLYAYLHNAGKREEEQVNKWWIQSGAENSDDNGMYLEIGQMNTRVLGIRDLDASTLEGARDAIGRMEPALLKLNNIRSKIGAQQNRLEHTIKNQLNVIENTQASESLIRDADMADEMVKFSKEGILQQTGQAMLSQANQSNQGVLSLLQ